MADVAVTLDWTVSGLKEPMRIAPELAAYLMSNPGAGASFVADLDRRKCGCPPNARIWLSSPVQACR
jgi:hypothetical protein